MNWDACLQSVALTDIGMRRATNQDAHAIVLASDREMWQHHGHLFVVADGMGAHAAGELASELAVSGIAHHYYKYGEMSAPEALEKAFLETNSEVHRRGRANLDFHNMGTTTSALVLLPQGALIAHVGDSRVYRLHRAHLEQLTFDHSLVWELRKAGQFDEDSSFAHSVPRNVITRSLGPNADLQVDLEGPYPVEIGDTFLLCSDGLTGQVPDDEIGPILANVPPKEAAQALVDLANLRGGPDNITVLVIKVLGDELVSRPSTAKPLSVGGGEPPRKTGNPIFWVVLGICGLLAVALFVAGQRWWAGLAAVAGVVTLLMGLARHFRPVQAPAVVLSETHRLGKGPYKHLACAAANAFVEKLARTISELRSASNQHAWAIDWSAIDSRCQRAAAAAAAKPGAAVREYVLAISQVMAELRAQRARRPNGLAPGAD